MPITNNAEAEEAEDTEELVAVALSAYRTSNKAELAQYHHQSLWSPPPSTLLKAIANHQLDSFPGLTKGLLKNLPPSTATPKGHMHKNRKNLRSTRANPKDITDARADLSDMNPAQEMCSAQESDIYFVFPP